MSSDTTSPETAAARGPAARGPAARGPAGHGAGSVAPEARPASAAPEAARQPYEKPCFRTIDLAAEEVLAVGCKLDGGPGGPIGASCTASSCFAAGS